MENNANVQAFAKSVAELMGGNYVAPSETMDYEWRATVTLPNDVQLFLHKGYNLKGKVSVSISPTDMGRDVLNMAQQRFRYGADKCSLESINVDPNRDPVSVVADIQRRLVTANAETLAKYRAYAAEIADRRDGLQQQIAELKAQYPMLKVNVSDDKTTATASYYEGDKGSFELTLYSGGSMSVRNVSIPSSRMPAFLKLMLED